ncbi:hypothetical protein CFP56_000227 [Quercus suber]|uniref:Transducin/WD40 repeat-like superfamily protein n=1 Tax=Quercus suber TaxID=58331 RepID=A0AAW0MIT6_QUESU
MLRLRAFRPTNDKIVKIELHPTHPWLVTADASDHVSVWNWEHRQVIYELKAGGVDERRLVGAKLEKLAEGESEPKGKPIEAMPGGVDERRLVGAKLEKLAEGESEPKGKPIEAMRGGSVKQVNFYDDDVRFWQLWRNRSAAAEAPSAVNQFASPFNSPPSMEFLSRSVGGDGPLVAFGGSDGVIRVLSMITWKLVRRYTGGHKGSISCLMTFVASSGEALLVSGASDGLLVLWSADHSQDSRELVPKLSLKAHDGGVIAVELSRVVAGAPQLITIGADKTLAIWDTISFKELRRIKPVPKLACHSVASWCHPRAPNLDILTCVKDSHIWAIEHPTYSALTRPLCELSSLVPPQVLAPSKKLRVYCMVAHPLQPHLVATGTNIGVIVCEFDSRSLPAIAPLPTPSGSREHSAVYVVEKELKLLNFQLSNTANPSLGNNSSISETGRFKGDSFEPLPVKQIKKHISTPVPHDSYSVLSVSSSGKYLAIVWPDIPYFSIYKVIGLHGGALLGVAYRTSRRINPVAATAISTIQSMPLSGFGSGGLSSFSTFDDGFSSHKSPGDATAQNFQLYSWETFQPVGGLLPQPEWTAWDQTVEYCAFAYQQYIVISSLRPQFRYLGDVAIPCATSAVWHRRQLFVATPTTIECVFVDAGVAPIDIETRKMKEQMKLKEAQARAIAEHGDLALINVDGPQSLTQERISLRPPMLQVVRLASFQHAPSIPPYLTMPKQSKVDGDDSAIPNQIEDRKVNEIAVGGGGVSVAVTRFPTEQKRPVGPLVVVGVRDGVLWLIDRYMCAHALSLSHPGIRCRCLAAYGDAVSAVKWASRLGREHHDDLAQFMLGMGYATEALHLPGISKRLEFDLAMQSNDLKRALQCLLTMSNSRDIGQDTPGLNMNDILSLTAKKENVVEAVEGIVKFAKEFLDLIDAADATAQGEIAREALKRLAAAGSVKGALQGHELRGLSLRLANHGELTRLNGLVNNLISVGLGREAAFSAAVLGDNALMEKAWQDTGMLAEAVLHAHAHGRPTMKNLVQAWNKMLQKEVDHTPSTKTDAASAFLASLEEPKLTSLGDAGKKPPIEIFPPGMTSLSISISAQKKPAPANQSSQQQQGKQLLLEAPPATTPVSAPLQSDSTPGSAPPQSESTEASVSAALQSESTPAPVSTPLQSESSEPVPDNRAPGASSVSDPVSVLSGATVPETSTINSTLAEAPPQAPEILETSIPTTLPMSDPLA